MDINIFTAALRSEFLKSWQEIDPAKLAPWEKFTGMIDSTARLENYSWMSPPPGVQEYMGHRRFANIDSIKYAVLNKEYDSSFTVLNRDIEDDQVGGYKLLATGLAQKCKMFPGRLVLQSLANGKTTTCFDGSNFFNATHNLGTYASGGNIIAHTSTGSSDSTSHVAVLLYTGNAVKPMMYQNRKAPTFNTDGGTPQSLLAKKTNYWTDLEGAAVYGWWWDAVWTDITNTPSVVDIHEILRKMQARMRTFGLPKAIGTDPTEFTHEQSMFDANNCVLVTNPAIEAPARQALNAEWIPSSIGGTPVSNTNLYKGAADLVVSAYLGS